MVRKETRYNMDEYDIEYKYKVIGSGWMQQRVISEVILRKKVTLPLKNKVVIFTGELSRFERIEAQTLAKNMGAVVKDTVPASGSVDFVIVGSNPGSKLKNAIGKGAEVVNDREWNSLVENWQAA